jgi:hypothetical protein
MVGALFDFFWRLGSMGYIDAYETAGSELVIDVLRGLMAT